MRAHEAGSEVSVDPPARAPTGRTEERRPVDVCSTGRVAPGGGVAALVHDHQVAVFRTDDDHWFALDNRDPFTGAQVLSRGIVGAHGAVPTVASPLRKQRFDLRTGACLDDPSASVAVHGVGIVDQRVVVTLSVATRTPDPARKDPESVVPTPDPPIDTREAA